MICRKIELANKHINNRIKSGQSYEEAWNNSSIELVEAAEIHGRIFIVDTFHQYVQKLDVSNSLKEILQQLDQLYAVSQALKLSGHLLLVSITLEINC